MTEFISTVRSCAHHRVLILLLSVGLCDRHQCTCLRLYFLQGDALPEFRQLVARLLGVGLSLCELLRTWPKETRDVLGCSFNNCIGFEVLQLPQKFDSQQLIELCKGQVDSLWLTSLDCRAQ